MCFFEINGWIVLKGKRKDLNSESNGLKDLLIVDLSLLSRWFSFFIVAL